MCSRVREHRIGQTDGKDLIRPDRAIALSAVDDVVQTAGRLVPKKAVNTGVCSFSHRARLLLTSGMAIRLCQRLHDAQGIVPQRLNFHGLTIAWGHYPVTDPRIHPGELHPWLSSREQTVSVDFDAVVRPVYMPGDDVSENI